MKKSISNRHSAMIILGVVLAPLVIHAMDATIWLFQMDLTLFNKLYAGFATVGIFSLIFLKIINGKIRSIKKLAVSVFALYMFSLNATNTFLFTDVLIIKWEVIIITTPLAIGVAWIVWKFAKFLKDEIEIEAQNQKRIIDDAKVEGKIQEQTVSLEEYLEVKQNRNRYWKMLEESRAGYIECKKRELNSKIKYCPNCNTTLNSIKNINQN